MSIYLLISFDIVIRFSIFLSAADWQQRHLAQLVASRWRIVA